MTDSERKKLFERARREVLHRRTAIQRDTAAEIIRLLKVARDRIRETLAAQPSDYERWQLPQLQRQIEARLAEFERGASTSAAAAASQSWDAGARLVDAPLQASGFSQAIATLPALDPRQLEAMKLFTTDRIKGLAAAVIDKINTELGLVILGVQSPGEAIGHIATLLGKDARQRAITIVRTEIGRAFSAAALERLKAAAAKVPGMKKMWRRSGKIHSRPEHDAIDGEVRDPDDPFEVVDSRTGEVIELQYPRDPSAPLGQTINCGCEILPYKDDWGISTAPTPFTEQELPASELRRNPVKAGFVARQRRTE